MVGLVSLSVKYQCYPCFVYEHVFLIVQSSLILIRDRIVI